MNPTSSESKNKQRIPIGIVLMTSGIIIIGFVLVILLVAPHTLPVDLRSFTSVQDEVSQLIPAIEAILPDLENKTQMAPDRSSPTLYAEASKRTSGLPSSARMDEAPRSYQGQSNSQPTRIVIPKINVDAPVRSVSLIPQEQKGGIYYQWQVPDGYEVGWHENSAPLGQPGNTVLNGHNNIYGEVFRNLIDLEIGDDITLYDTNQPYSYVVTRREVLPETGQPLSVRLLNARWMEPTRDERITLISCWPYVTNSHRLVVVAEPANLHNMINGNE